MENPFDNSIDVDADTGSSEPSEEDYGGFLDRFDRMDSDEIKIRVRELIKKSTSEAELRSLLRKELGYHHGPAISWLGPGAAMVMLHHPTGVIQV